MILLIFFLRCLLDHWHGKVVQKVAASVGGARQHQSAEGGDGNFLEGQPKNFQKPQHSTSIEANSHHGSLATSSMAQCARCRGAGASKSMLFHFFLTPQALSRRQCCYSSSFKKNCSRPTGFSCSGQNYEEASQLTMCFHP